jgi:methyltransferase-like protein 23
MAIRFSLEQQKIGDNTISLYIPDPILVREEYLSKKKTDPDTDFPYWSQLWPAATGLSIFLDKHQEYIKDKIVLEIGAGVGLPSFFAASIAKEVIATDYLPVIVECLQATANYNKLTNFKTALLDWNTITTLPTVDVLLISDINYDPLSFDVIQEVLEKFIEQGTTVLLATPQRLMAKYFLNRLETKCLYKEVVIVEKEKAEVAISVWVLARVT